MERRVAKRIMIPAGVLLSLLLVLARPAYPAAPPGAWWDPDWQYRRQLTVSPAGLALQTQAIPEYQALFEGESIKIRPVVEADPDGYAYALMDGPPDGNWDAATGTWTWTTTYLHVGAHQVTFRATDLSDPGHTIDLTTQVNVYPDMTPPRWQKYDPDDDGYANAVMVAEPGTYPWEMDTVRDPTLAVYAESGLPYQNGDGEYMMYYSGGNSFDTSDWYQVGLATSTDLIHWTKYAANPVLGHGSPGSWDAQRVSPGSVLVMDDGTFRMYYSATGGGSWGSSGRIGMATSNDGGLSWTRSSDNPILVPSGSPVDASLNLPYAIKTEGDNWIMMTEISGVDPQYLWFVVGLATSSDDGITWSKLALPEYYALLPGPAGAWDGGCVANPKPMKLGEQMYVVGYNGSSLSLGDDYDLGIAISFDAIHWHKYGSNPILVANGDGVGDGYRIEGLQWLKDQFGQNHMDMIYFGGDRARPNDFRITLATMDIPDPVPPDDPTYLTRGTVYQDFSSSQEIVNDVTPDATLEAGYTVQLTLDTAALVSAGNMQANGSDLRVLYWNGSSWQELDRLLEEVNTDHTRVLFRTQADIDGSDDNYYLYYGHPTAGSPPGDWGDVCAVGDDFGDGTLSANLYPSTGGSATITETGGELVMDLTTDNDDAAIVSTRLDGDRQFAVRHKMMCLNTGDSNAGPNWAVVVQNTSQPTVAANTTFNATRRVFIYESASGPFGMRYIDTANVHHCWNGSAWVLCTTTPWAYTGTCGTYYIAEIVSDGSTFYQVLRDVNGTILTQTTPVAWNQVYSDGNPFWLVWGEPYTSHYYVDMRSDFFCLRDYVSPEPAVEIGPEEEYPPTAVSLASFTAEPDGAGKITVRWETTNEIDNLGFNLYRSQAPAGTYLQSNETLIHSQAPGSPQGSVYTWVDRKVQPGVTYYYKLEDVDFAGRGTLHGPVWAVPDSIYSIHLPLLHK